MLAGFIICIIVECIVFCFMFGACRALYYKRQNGDCLVGKRISYKEVPGRPKRYIIDVVVTLKQKEITKKIITTDKSAKKYEKEEDIPLKYVAASNKFFWRDETDTGYICFIAILGGIFLVVLSCILIIGIVISA